MKIKLFSNITIALALLGLSLGAANLKAQETAPQAQPTKKAHSTPAEQLATISAKYGLTEEQKQKVGVILDDEAKESSAIRKNQSLTKEDRKAKLSELHKASEAKIHALLTPEQLKKQPKAHAKKDAGTK